MNINIDYIKIKPSFVCVIKFVINGLQPNYYFFLLITFCYLGGMNESEVKGIVDETENISLGEGI